MERANKIKNLMKAGKGIRRRVLAGALAVSLVYTGLPTLLEHVTSVNAALVEKKLPVPTYEFTFEDYDNTTINSTGSVTENAAATLNGTAAIVADETQEALPVRLFRHRHHRPQILPPQAAVPIQHLLPEPLHRVPQHQILVQTV